MNELEAAKESATAFNQIQLKDANVLVNYIIQCPAIFRSQQIKEPDLNFEEKRQIAEDLLLNKPVAFLIRFGKYLKEEHLDYFTNNYKTSYEVSQYVKNLKTLLCENTKNLIKRNRRFEAMVRMEKNGTYFTDNEMEKRDPIMYHLMVGQYLSDHEKFTKYKESNANLIPTFSNFLIEKLEKEEVNSLLKLNYKKEENYRLYPGSSKSNIELQSFEAEDNTKKKWAADWEDKEISRRMHFEKTLNNKQIPPKEKFFLYQEFKSYMHSKFINGEDSDFNYSEVDSNPDYDSLHIRGQDEEDKYFDEETCDNEGECTDTGIEDY